MITVEPGGSTGVPLDIFKNQTRLEFLSSLQPNLEYPLFVLIVTDSSQLIHKYEKE